jgi:hypothetical protein|tara:strand:+ start:1307 stop:1804 length:498 start_codon:yes stop_codon:yes gene_type:complete
VLPLYFEKDGKLSDRGIGKEEAKFQDKLMFLLHRYNQTSLLTRWDEAFTSCPDSSPLASWIRESDDFVHIVWVNPVVVWDITFYPKKNLSTFNITRLAAITGLGVQEGVDVAKQRGLAVAGRYIVDVFVTSNRAGHFTWVASTTAEETALRAVVVVLSKLLLVKT